MKRKSFIGVVVLAVLLVYAGITEAGGWMHETSDGWMHKSENVGPTKLRVENLPALEEGESWGPIESGTIQSSSKSADLRVENLPAFEEGESWGPIETGTIPSGRSAKHGMENPTILEGGKYGGD